MSVGRLAGAIFDNPMTRSWQGTVDRAVTGPIGRRLASDEVLQQGVADMVGGLPMPKGGVHPMQVEMLNRLARRSDLTAEQVYDLASADVRAKEAESISGWIADQALTNADERGASRATLQASAAELARLHGGRTGLTDAGSTVRQFGLGSPVAAYAAVGGSTALLVKGAMDVYARMQAGQPVSEEEAVAAAEVLKSVRKESEEVVP